VGTVTCFIGIDPGPTTGVAVAYWDGGWSYPGAYQCDAKSAPAMLDWLLKQNAALGVRAQTEEFRLGTGAGARGKPASATRSLADELTGMLDRAGVPYSVHPAATVKPWATDKRLEKAGLIEVTAGMPKHARDAFRHLLFCAVHDGGVPDPLSRRGN
jgi:hypothetical protein